LVNKKEAQAYIRDDEYADIKKKNTNVYVWGEGIQISTT
jgi:hypothetical protein